MINTLLYIPNKVLWLSGYVACLYYFTMALGSIPGQSIFLLIITITTTRNGQEWPRTSLVHSYGIFLPFLPFLLKSRNIRNGPGMTLGKFTKISSFPLHFLNSRNPEDSSGRWWGSVMSSKSGSLYPVSVHFGMFLSLLFSYHHHP